MRLFQWMPKAAFTRNLLTVLSGTMLAQIISICATPIISRFFSPAEFGYYGQYMSIVSIVAVLVTGRYELAIMLPDDDDEAKHLATLSAIITVIVSFMSLFVIFLMNSLHISYIEDPVFLYLIPFHLLAFGFYQISLYWIYRYKQYKTYSIATPLQSILTTGFNIGFGVISAGKLGLIATAVIVQYSAAVMLGRRFIVDLIFKDLRGSVEPIKKVMLKYIDYPKKSLVSALLNVSSYQVEYFLLPVLFSLYEVGYYYLINKIAHIPQRLLGSATWQVFLSESRGKETTEVFKLMYHYQKKMISIITLPVFSSFFIFADAWKLIFGQAWEGAIPFFYPTMVASHMNIVVASFSLFIIINRPDAEMVVNGGLFIAKIGAILIGWSIFNSFYYSIIATSLVQGLLFFLLGSWNYVKLGQSSTFFLKLYVSQLIKIVPYITMIFLVQLIWHNYILVLGCVIILNLYHMVRLKNDYTA